MQVATPFLIRRLGVLMEPNMEDPKEAWGVLNPACVRGRDGQLYLFPRVVAKDNFSCIDRARVLFNEEGDPTGVERLGCALEPNDLYECNPTTGGGCEDPRITYVPVLDCYIMVYTAFSIDGSRIALASSKDLQTWERLGLLHYDRVGGIDLNHYGNKDGMLIPEPVIAPDGSLSFAFIHRPSYKILQDDGTFKLVLPAGIADSRESMWISYCPLHDVQRTIHALANVSQSRLLAIPEQSWEELKIGGGTPPVLTPYGWFLIYHGVSGHILEGVRHQQNVYYSAGVMILDRTNPARILYRSPEPVLTPEQETEQKGLIPNVVFPTGVDLREDNRLDVYYGMADSRIGVGWLNLVDVSDEIHGLG